MKYRVDLLICESTVRTVDDTVELSLSMESETEIIVNSFTFADIFPPRELDFIAIPIDFWRSDDRMPDSISCKFTEVMKCLFHLSFLDTKLIFISDSEPLRTTIELVSWQERDFERRLLHDIEFLSFVVRFSLLQHSHIHDTSGDTPSRNDDFATIRRDTKSLPSEDELVDGDVFEYLIFWHKIIRVKMGGL